MTGTCTGPQCDRVIQAKGLCTTHYIQRWRGYELTVIKPRHRPALPRPRKGRVVGGKGFTDAQGYRYLFRPDHPNAQKSGKILEHVYVMAEKLGRPLRKGENVHHLNGVRDDNRPENLELWRVSQPPGQRASDLVVSTTSWPPGWMWANGHRHSVRLPQQAAGIGGQGDDGRT
jgi:hypothetical protein